MSQTWHSTASTAGQLAQDAQHRASRMSQYTYDSMSYYGNQMAGLGHRVLDDVRFYGNQARWKTMSGYKNGRRAFWNAVDDSPLLMGAGLLALGLCAGLLLPRTRSEDEWIGEYSDDMKHQVMHSGQDLMNRSMDAAGASIDTAVHEAEAQGLTPQQLLEKGKHIVTKAAQSIPSAVMDAAKEEGVDPHSIKEKVGTVAQKTTETAKDKSKVEKEEPRNEMKKDLHK
jgi:hypothetical protein